MVGAYFQLTLTFNFFKHDERVGRAKEAIQIIKKLWNEDDVTFHGKYYSITKGIAEPKPNQRRLYGTRECPKHRVILWLKKLTAGLWNDEAKENIADMQEHLIRKSRTKIEFAIPTLTFIGSTDEAAKTIADKIIGGRKNVLDHTLETGLIGSPETVAQKIKKLESIGINHVLLQLTPTLTELPNVQKVLDLLRR